MSMVSQQGIWTLGPLARAMANTEASGFKVLNLWIKNCPQVSIVEDAEEQFVVSGSQG